MTLPCHKHKGGGIDMEHVEMVQPSTLGVVGRTLVFSLLALGFTFMLL
ncbi:hypothetical protein FXE78_06790 [Vibrio mimicus]|nr:hypothetical protein FXE78_06790 [Vibrio mimicus]TXZ08532.1 hypothetical protein FXE63_05105 [Vibrio mimicus]